MFEYMQFHSLKKYCYCFKVGVPNNKCDSFSLTNNHNFCLNPSISYIQPKCVLNLHPKCKVNIDIWCSL